MPAVIAVMLVAVCEPNLLICSPLKAFDHAWASVESCRADRDWVMDAVRARAGGSKRVMGTCRLFLDEGRTFRKKLLAGPPPAAMF